MLKDEPELTDEEILAKILAAADAQYQVKVDLVGREAFGNFERSITLQSIDQHWREHLSALDYLRQGIHLRGYAQKNPKQEYKREAFELFELMLQTIRNEVTRVLMNVQIQSAAEAEQVAEQVEDKAEAAYGGAQYVHADAAGAGDTAPRRIRSRWRCACMRPSAPSRMRASSRSAASARRSAATIRAPAARGRSTSSATVGWFDGISPRAPLALSPPGGAASGRAEPDPPRPLGAGRWGLRRLRLGSSERQPMPVTNGQCRLIQCRVMHGRPRALTPRLSVRNPCSGPARAHSRGHLACIPHATRTVMTFPWRRPPGSAAASTGGCRTPPLAARTAIHPAMTSSPVSAHSLKNASISARFASASRRPIASSRRV